MILLVRFMIIIFDVRCFYVNPWTTENTWMRSQYCGYWWAGALADEIFIVLEQFETEILLLWRITLENEITLCKEKKNKQMFWGSLISPYCHIYASLNPVSIGSGNGLSPEQRQAITGTNADLLSIGPLGTNFSEIVIKIPKFSFMKMPLKMLSAKRRPFCPGEDELRRQRWGKILAWMDQYQGWF